MRQLALVANRRRRAHQRARIEIKDRFGVWLIARLRIIACQYQHIAYAIGGRTNQLTLQCNPIAIPAGQLEYGINAVSQQYGRGNDGVQMRACAGPIRYVYRIGKARERLGLCEQIGGVARQRRRHFRSQAEFSCSQRRLQGAGHHAVSSNGLRDRQTMASLT